MLQPTIALSTTKVECTMEAIWLNDLVEELGITQHKVVLH